MFYGSLSLFESIVGLSFIFWAIFSTMKRNKKIKQMNNVKTKLEKGEAVYPYDLDALSDKEYHELTGVKRDKRAFYVLFFIFYFILMYIFN